MDAGSPRSPRTAVITGGGRGIGRAVALAFAEPGAHIVITSRTRSQLDATAAEITAKGAPGQYLSAIERLTMITPCASSVSRASNSRPRINGTPIARKYPGVIERVCTDGPWPSGIGCSSTWNPWLS